MATRRARDRARVPLDDEEDILEEVGAETDENGETVADIEAVQKIGALDAESVRENRQRRKIAMEKKSKGKVSFGTSDPIDKYQTLMLSGYAPNQVDIWLQRLSGGPSIKESVTSQPRNGRELFEAVKAVHAANGGREAQWELRFRDAGSQQALGQGRVTLPDVHPPGQPPMAYSPQQPAQPVAQAPAQDMNSMFSLMTQMFDFFQKTQQTAPGQQVQPPPVVMPPPPSNPNNPGEMMAYMTQMFELVKRMQPQQAPVAHAPQPVQPVQQAQPAAPMGMPAFQPPHGTQWMFDPRGGWVAVPVPGQERRPPPRSYDEGGGPRGYNPQGPQGGPSRFNGAPPPRQMSAADQLRETISTVRSAAAVLREFEDVIPGATGRAAREPEEEHDDGNPYSTQKIGELDVLRDENGEAQFWPSVMVNAPKAFKWLGEAYEKVQKNAEQQRRQEQRRVLSPGLIEVIPGQPVNVPPGMVAMRIDPEEERRIMQEERRVVVTPAPAPREQLPPAPTNVPPPIQAQPSQSWGLPSMEPHQGEE